MNKKVLSLWIVAMFLVSLGTVPVLQGGYVKAENGQILAMSIDSSRFPDAVLVRVSIDAPYILTKTAFEIYENGKKQQIVNFDYTSGKSFVAPVDLVFIIDRSRSMEEDINDIKNNAYKLAEDLKNLGVDARFALITFGLNPDDARVDLSFTSDVSKLKQALDSIVISGGTEWSFDGIMEAINLNFRSTAQIVFIVVTDEDDQSNYTIEEVANKVKSKGVFLVLVYDHNNGHRLSQLSQAVGALDMDILEARQKGFGEVLQRITTTIGQQYHITYSPTNKSMDGSEREVKVVIHLPDGSTLEATGSYVAPTEKREKYKPKYLDQELLEVLNNVSQWIIESENNIYRSALRYSWELNLERPYIPRLPGEFSFDFLEFVVDANTKLGVPSVSNDGLRLLLEFLGKNKEYPIKVENFKIDKISEGVYRISRDELEFYVIAAKASKVQKQTINLFGISRDIYLTLYMGAIFIRKDISFENARLKLFLRYLEAGGQVDGIDVFHESVLLPYVIVESLGSSKVLKPGIKVPLLDGEIYGGVGGGGKVAAKILGEGIDIGVLLELIQLQASLREVLEKKIGSVSLGSAASLKIEVGGVEFKRTLGISTELGSGISVGDYTKIFMGYLAYNLLPSIRIGIPFVWEGMDLKDGAYVFMVRTIEGLSDESRKRTYLHISEEYSLDTLTHKLGGQLPIRYYVPKIKKVLVGTVLTPIFTVFQMEVTIIPIGKYIVYVIQLSEVMTTYKADPIIEYKIQWIERIKKIPYSAGGELYFKRTSKTNLLPISSPDYRYQEEVGFYFDISKKFEIKIPVGHGISLELGKVKIAEIGIFATAFGKIGFETPIFAIELVDPPLGGSTIPEIRATFVNETSIDKNADGQFEKMRIVFNVTTNASGKYYIYPFVYSENTSTMLPVKKIEANIERDCPTRIEVDIPGQYIYYTNHTGPFDIGLVIQDENGTLVYYNFTLGKTKSYDYRQFEHVIPEFSFEYTPIDLDGDEKYDKIKVNITEINNLTGITLMPMLTAPGWIIYLNSTNLTSTNTYTMYIDGMHVRKLMGNFTLLIHVANMTNGVYLGSYQWNITVEDPLEFESTYPTIEDAIPMTVNYEPAVTFTVNVPSESNISITTQYEVGNTIYEAHGYFENVTPGIHNLTVFLDESAFVMHNTRSATILSATLISNGLTTDSVVINKEASFFLLPRAKVWNVTQIINTTTKVLNTTIEVMSYENINATIVVTFSSGNVTLADFIYPEMNRGVTLEIPVVFNLSEVISNLSKQGTLTVVMYNQEGKLLAIEKVPVDLSVLLPTPPSPAQEEEQEEEKTYTNILVLSQLWTTWFFKYYDEFNKLYQNATVIGIDNETLQKALELHNNATELIKEAWHTDNLDDIKAKLWREVKIIPKIIDVRKAFLKEKEAVKILREAIEKASSS